MSADADRPICTQHADTGRWTGAQLLEHWRALELGAEEDLRSALGSAAEELTGGGQRRRQPESPGEELELRAACLRMGRELVEQARGTSPAVRSPG